MSLLCSGFHIFTTQTRIFSSIQFLVNEKFIHQSSFKLIKTFFISPASIYATLFTKVGGKSGGKSPRPVCVCIYLCMYIIHSFIPAISIAPIQVLYYSEALPTTARILYRSFTPKRT